MKAVERAVVTRWQGGDSEKGLFFSCRSFTEEAWAEGK